VLNVTLPTPAPAPTNLHITAAYAQALVMGWTGTGPFKVEQQNSDGTWTTLAPVWQSNTFMAWNLSVSTSYTFRVSGADAGQGGGGASTITASTTAVPGSANTVVNNGPYGYSLSLPSRTQTHGSDIGKLAITFTKSGANFDPPNPRLSFSPSQYDPSIGKPNLQGWSEYSTGVWYNNDVYVPSTAGTYYLWVMTEDGYSYLDPGNPWTIT
jgi:hypothetical protein